MTGRRRISGEPTARKHRQRYSDRAVIPVGLLLCLVLSGCLAVSPSGGHHPTPTPAPTPSATPTATPTPAPTPAPIIPAVCTHQAAVEFASLFDDGLGDGLKANCPDFAATRLNIPPFTTLPAGVDTEIGFDNSVSQYGGAVDYSGFAKFTNFSTTWHILPNDTKEISFHEFYPTDSPEVIYFFLYVWTDVALDECAVQYVSSECGGVVK